MKLPNGFGTVFKLSGNRRRPYVVKKSINGKQKIIGYFETYSQGMCFLVEYNKDPALFSNNITFRELYNRWRIQKFPRLSKSSISSYKVSFKHCKRLHDMPFRMIKFGHLQEVINDIRLSGSGYATQKKCRVLMEQLYEYASKYDVVTRDYAKFVEVDQNKKKHKKQEFTSHQINKLWRGIGEIEGVEDILMMIYSGVRPGEYIALETKDIKIRRKFFIVHHSKTEAGCERPVPIANKVYSFYCSRIQSGNRYLCQRQDGRKHSYETFRRIFDKVMNHFNIKRLPHEARHTCASMLDRAGANDTSTKRILGHACKGVTKRDYTHKNLRDLHKSINMI